MSKFSLHTLEKVYYVCFGDVKYNTDGLGCWLYSKDKRVLGMAQVVLGTSYTQEMVASGEYMVTVRMLLLSFFPSLDLGTTALRSCECQLDGF